MSPKLTLSLCLAVATALTAQSPNVIPDTMPLQGRLALQAGGNAAGTLRMVFRFYNAATGGVARWTETQPAVRVTKGLFKTELGSVAGFPPGLFDGKKLFLGIQIGTDSEMVPRIVMTSQPFAQMAQNAKDVKDRDIHPRSVRIGATTVIDNTGRWVGPSTGLRGPQGVTGPRGPVGATGTAGARGSTGPQGVRGLPGSAGASGPRGGTGPSGPTGPQGPKGQAGATGVSGATGAAGPRGATGAVGSRGLGGPRGLAGARGPQGASPFRLNGANAYYNAGRVSIGTSGLGGTGAPLYAQTFTANAALQASNHNTTGNPTGIWASSNGPTGFGLYGVATGTGGIGTYGRTSGTAGHGVYGYHSATTGRGAGVFAWSRSSSGAGVHSFNSSLTGSANGMYAETKSVRGIGLNGLASARSGRTHGVTGTSYSTLGTGVRGVAGGASGVTIGVQGTTWTSAGVGVDGRNEARSGNAVGVRGETRSLRGWGVYGTARRTTSATGYGVYGSSNGAFGRGVYGFASGSRGRGVYGFASGGPAAFAVYASGKMAATSLKSFIQPHPQDASKNVMFVCLEGNESGTYFRGTTKLVNKRAEIPIPESWQLVSADHGITVQLSPVRSLARITVLERSRDRIVVIGDADCEFDFFVNGLRRGFTKFDPMIENVGFKPMVRGVPYGVQYPKDLRDILVQNGTLNPDYTPNEATAKRLGWQLIDAADVPIAERHWIDDETRDRLRAERDRPRIEADREMAQELKATSAAIDEAMERRAVEAGELPPTGGR